MTATPITPEERQAIIATLHETESIRETARRHKRGEATIGRIAKAEGIAPAARARTQRATEAKKIDNAARRAELETLLLEDALRLRRQLWEPAEYKTVTKDGTVVRYTMDRPTFGDQRNVMVAAGIAVDKAVALSRIGTDGHAEARGLLVRLVTRLEEAASIDEAA